MKGIFRIIDANVNRIAEGLRVLEDVMRFYYNEAIVVESIKKLRHSVRSLAAEMQNNMMNERNTDADTGLDISQRCMMDNRSTLHNLIAANFKRVQEGLRVVEETCKIQGFYETAKKYENCRYQSYTLEKVYMRKIHGADKSSALDTDLYCITAEIFSNGKNNIQVVKSLVDSGIKLIQYREKEKNLCDKYKECMQIREMTYNTGATFIINDDIHIAMLVQADGVHIGQEDLPVKEVRKLVGDTMIIGVSTHSPKQAHQAVAEGADYIGVGPIFKTHTKKDVCAPVGLEYLKYVSEHIHIPFVAIGGIKEDNMDQVIANGASCIAMVTEIVGAKDIGEKVCCIRAKINRTKMVKEEEK